jgi:membrane protease subunit HflC
MLDSIKTLVGFVVAALLLVVVEESTFVVGEYQQAVVTQFGRPVKVVLGRHFLDKAAARLRAEVTQEIHREHPKGIEVEVGPGVYFKLAFMQSVNLFDGRATLYVAPAKDIVTHDKQKVLVDNYAVWRIENPHKFFTTVHDDHGARKRLEDFVYSIVRDQLSKYDLPEIVRNTTGQELRTAEAGALPAITRGGRDNILAEVTRQCNIQAKAVGLSILDVRIRRADLPDDNERAVFGRMIEERNRMSRKYRAEGNETLEKTKAETDLKVQTTLAGAEKNAQATRGAGDAEAARIYADAYAHHKDFYVFTKSLETLERSIGPETTLVVNTEKGVYRLLKSN